MAKSCPKCDKIFTEDKLSFFGGFTLAFFGEISIWIMVGILFAIFSLSSFETAYVLGIGALFIIIIFIGQFAKIYHCKQCNLSFSAIDLRKFKKTNSNQIEEKEKNVIS